jgi:hypothetical protein
LKTFPKIVNSKSTLRVPVFMRATDFRFSPAFKLVKNPPLSRQSRNLAEKNKVTIRQIKAATTAVMKPQMHTKRTRRNLSTWAPPISHEFAPRQTCNSSTPSAHPPPHVSHQPRGIIKPARFKRNFAKHFGIQTARESARQNPVGI